MHIKHIDDLQVRILSSPQLRMFKGSSLHLATHVDGYSEITKGQHQPLQVETNCTIHSKMDSTIDLFYEDAV